MPTPFPTRQEANNRREPFLLDPHVVYLNHGSYGACPRPVFERYQAWQRELEREPVDFLSRRLPGLFAEARTSLASYVGADPDDLVFVPNATYAINVVAQSLDLQAGDEILTTDLEYGACDLMWQHVSARTGARYVQAPVPLPLERPAQVVDAVFERLTERTRALFVSHVTSETALVLPVAELVRRAREAGVITIVDGAHGPGQLLLDLRRLGADVYAGNCHKWLCAPKGAGFLHVRRELQDEIDALVISWGYGAESTFVTRHERQATRDPAAYLSVPAAIEWVERYGESERCRALTVEAQRRLTELPGVEPLCPAEFLAQMVAVRVPTNDADALESRLRQEHGIEVPVKARETEPLLRVSIAPYNDESDLDRLLEALPPLLRWG
ncbi:MAG TPA: aminotransferase class V-fold PLP-dependent enzyme [Gaiellaceae bacterium]|nr:aminotransferase class V-fold PLP-dependent enzyme [Gaiellaceae bacterium]